MGFYFMKKSQKQRQQDLEHYISKRIKNTFLGLFITCISMILILFILDLIVKN